MKIVEPQRDGRLWAIPSVGWQAWAHADAQAIAVASGVARTKDASEGKMTFQGS